MRYPVLTKRVPAEPGYYWCQPFMGCRDGRELYGFGPRPVLVFVDDDGPFMLRDNWRVSVEGHWWSGPIEPPASKPHEAKR